MSGNDEKLDLRARYVRRRNPGTVGPWRITVPLSAAMANVWVLENEAEEMFVEVDRLEIGELVPTHPENVS